jgi:hypothetical protein
MATLQAGTTFNAVRVWNGPSAQNSNTIVGYLAGQNMLGEKNTVFGSCSAYNTAPNAILNSTMGFASFAVNTPNVDGYGNVALGSRSMQNVGTNSGRNVALGFCSLFGGSAISYNVGIGSYVGRCLTGDRNVFVGVRAGGCVSNANKNIGIGYGSLYSLTNGNCNIAIGKSALNNVTCSNFNIGIGALAGCCVSTASNTISIGYASSTSNTNDHTAAGSANFTCFCVGAGSWTTLSDSRDKTDIEMLNDNLGLNFIRNLKPVKFKYDYRDNYVRKCGFEYGERDHTLKQDFETYGLIAQDVEDAITKVGTHFDALNFNEEEDNYRISYTDLISPIIKSLQQTIDRLEYLESKV